MNEFIETLKARQQDAQQRMQAAQHKLAVVQAEFQAAAQECNSWTVALNTEVRRQQQEAAVVAAAQATLPINLEANRAETPPATPANNQPLEITNKTEIVRDLLRQHPTGMTPGEIWKVLGTQIADHAYIYSVLKRLKDRDEVTKRRGKYFFKHHPQPQPEEVAAQNGVVQQQE